MRWWETQQASSERIGIRLCNWGKIANNWESQIAQMLQKFTALALPLSQPKEELDGWCTI